MLKELEKIIDSTFELIPIDGKKSFYGKAKVIKSDNVYFLLSYDTIICSFDDTKKILVKYWNDYSATSIRHFNAFMHYFGFMLGGKTFWNKLECNKAYTIQEFLNL